jgi:putative Ig domain-containing protein
LDLRPILCMESLEARLNTFWFVDRRCAGGWFTRVLVCYSLFLLTAGLSFGQQVALSLSSAIATPGSSAALTVSATANGGIQPAILQWTIQYPADVTSIEVNPAPAAAEAGKTITCSYGVSAATCLAWGENKTTIPDGPVATATFQISAASRNGSIAIINGLGSASDIEGNSLPVTSAGGAINLILPPVISCAPNSGPRLLNQYYSAQCSVTGGAPPYNWTVSSGALPSGINLISQGTSALIAGTPTVAGVYRYTISAVDSSSPIVGIGTLAYAVTIQASAPKFGLVGSLAHLVSNQDWTTTFTLVNTGAGDAQTELNLLGDDGNPLSVPLTLLQQGATESPVNTPSLDWTLASNASLIVQTHSPANVPLQSGSAQLGATGGLGGFAIFHLNPTAQEAVVPLETRNAGSYLLTFDDTNSAALGVALANIGTQAASVAVVVRDDTGVQIGSGSVSLPGSGHTSFVVSDQFPAAAGQRGTITFNTPAGGQISVLGVRTTPPGTLTTIPALANVGTNGGAVAHIAIANGWKTSFVLVNTGVSAAQVHLDFFDDDGNPLNLPLSSPQVGGGASTTASSVDRAIAAGATLVIESTGPDSNPLQTGSAQLTTDGNTSGFAIFRYAPTGQEAVVPFESRNANSYLLAFDNTGGIATGVGVSSRSLQAVSVPVVIRDDSGAQIGTGAIPLPANGHSAFVLGSQFPVTEGKRGTVEFATPAGGQISVVGIRSPPTHTFTTLPALTR